MHFKTLAAASATALAASAVSASPLSPSSPSAVPENDCTERSDVPAPVTWGLMAFPGVDLLDVYGPLELLYFVAGNAHIDVKIINPGPENVVISPPMNNPHNSTFAPEIVGAASLDDDLDLDLLLVPGGAVTRLPEEETAYIDEYITRMFPKVDHFVTVCTGALFAARAGVLDNRRATTNKGAWDLVTEHGDNVTWVAPARWVRDDNVWTSSGVSSGIDLTFALIEEFYGKELADRISGLTEFVPRAHDDDPFTDIFGVPHQG